MCVGRYVAKVMQNEIFVNMILLICVPVGCDFII